MRRDEVLDWVAGQGFAPTGAARLAKERPWATVLEVTTRDDGPLWFKEGRAGCAFEARLLRALQAYGAPHVLRPLAVDVERGWMLLPDGGPTMRETGATLSDWERLLPKYAELQRSLERRALPGADDLRPARMAALLDQLLETVPVGPLEQLRAVQRRFGDWCDELTSAAVLPTLQHDDLHDNNVFADDTVFDFGDSCLGHPFSSLLVVLRSTADRFGLEPGAVELERLRDCYLEAWTGLHSRAELELLALLATRVGKVGRALAWQRALRGVADPGEHAEAVPGWLEELLEPDVF